MEMIRPIRYLYHFLRTGILLLVVAFAFFLSACEDENAPDPNAIRVGVVEGSLKGELLKAVQKVGVSQYNLKVKIQTYKTMEEVDKALMEGQIDADIFQPKVYWERLQNKLGNVFSVVAETYAYPMGVYSKRVKGILEVPVNGIVAIPNEPTNEARALFLLEKTGLIRMETDQNTNALVGNIASNPKNLTFKTIPSGQLVSQLPKVDIAVVNADFALRNGLDPSKNALAIENDMGYPNVVVVRKGEERSPRVSALVEILRSQEIQNAAQKIFKGDVTPVWKH